MNNKICELALHYKKNTQQYNIFLQYRQSIEQEYNNWQYSIQQKQSIEQEYNNWQYSEYQQQSIEIDNESKQGLQELEQKYDQSIRYLMDFNEKLEQFAQQIQQRLKKFKLQVEEKISQLVEKENQIKHKSKNFTKLQFHQIIEEKNIIKNTFSQIILELNHQLLDFEIMKELHELQKLLNSQQIDVNKRENEKIQIQKMVLLNKKFNYQLMQYDPYKYNQLCCAIAFNQDATLMIAGYSRLIKVFRFKDGQLREVGQLGQHLNTVSCLQFMKTSNQFISASYDSTIIIWGQNENYQWKCNQILKSHSSQICCITLNQIEDILISGSSDNTIKFWQKQCNIWSCYQSINCLSQVRAISLCDQDDKLIASLDNKNIFFIQLQNKEWIIKQKLSVDQNGFRLSFIGQNQFVFQPIDRQHLLIFDYDAKDQTFKQRQELQYQNKEVKGCYQYFPIRYISSIGLILVKNDRDIHLIKKKQNGFLTVEQSINFSTNRLFGSVTDDGRYIATWDYETQEIQIRKVEG